VRRSSERGARDGARSSLIDIMLLIGARGTGVASAIGIGSVNDRDDGHTMVGYVDPVDHAIRTATGAVSIIERWSEPLADPLWIVEQWSNDELVRRKRDRLG
jgi:hypothetical protein